MSSKKETGGDCNAAIWWRVVERTKWENVLSALQKLDTAYTGECEHVRAFYEQIRKARPAIGDGSSGSGGSGGTVSGLLVVSKDPVVLACARLENSRVWSLSGEDPWTVAGMDVSVVFACFPRMRTAELVARVMHGMSEHGYTREVHERFPYLRPHTFNHALGIEYVESKDAQAASLRASGPSGRPRSGSLP